jgi:hypothetical protein
MNARILIGSKQEIAAGVASIPGEVREAIVFIEEPSEIKEERAGGLFSDMDQFAAKAGGADYSREALYSRVGHE